MCWSTPAILIERSHWNFVFTKFHNNGRSNLIDSIWMVASMAAFDAEDAFVKAATATVPVS